MSDVPTLVYELALRSLEQQERELSELRARTNTVIAASALIASFLGAAAVREHGGLSVWSIGALLVLSVTGALSLLVLWPRELRFAFDARKTYAELYPLLENVAEARLRGLRSAGSLPGQQADDRLARARLPGGRADARAADGALDGRRRGSMMFVAEKPTSPAPSPPDKVEPLPATVFISEKRGGDGATSSTR